MIEYIFYKPTIKMCRNLNFLLKSVVRAIRCHSKNKILTSYAYDISIYLTGVSISSIWSSTINSNTYKMIYDISI